MASSRWGRVALAGPARNSPWLAHNPATDSRHKTMTGVRCARPVRLTMNDGFGKPANAAGDPDAPQSESLFGATFYGGSDRGGSGAGAPLRCIRSHGTATAGRGGPACRPSP